MKDNVSSFDLGGCLKGGVIREVCLNWSQNQRVMCVLRGHHERLTKTKLELGLGTPPKESPLGHSFGKVHGVSVLRPTVSC